MTLLEFCDELIKLRYVRRGGFEGTTTFQREGSQPITFFHNYGFIKINGQKVRVDEQSLTRVLKSIQFI